MSPYHLIVVREAQYLNRTIDQFENYFKEPVPTTILVFCYKNKKIDKRKSIGKVLAKNSFLFDAEPVRDYNLPDWVMNCAKQKNLTLEERAAVLLEFGANDLAAIDKNMDKLMLLTENNKPISIETVQKHIGFSKDFNLFELTDKVIAAVNVTKATLIAKHFGSNNKSHPLVVTIGHLYGFFTKLMKYHFYETKLGDRQLAAKIGVHPFFLQYQQAARYYTKAKLAKILGDLRYFDLMSKGVYSPTNSEADILKEMIFKIMH